MRRAPWRYAGLMFVSLVSVLAATAARAESPAGARPERVTESTMFWRTGQQEALVPAPVLKTDVHMVVTGIVARASVRQEFINPEARYEQAKHEGKRASLVEEERPNIFTTSAANIPPGTTITVEIEYQQAIRYDGRQFRLRFPMVIGPRYIPGTGQVPDASRLTPPVEHPARGALNPVSLRVELDPRCPPGAGRRVLPRDSDDASRGRSLSNRAHPGQRSRGPGLRARVAVHRRGHPNRDTRTAVIRSEDRSAGLVL